MSVLSTIVLLTIMSQTFCQDLQYSPVGIRSQFIPRAPDQSNSQQPSPSSSNSSDQLQNSYVVGIRSQFIQRAPDQSNSQQSSPGNSNSSDQLQNSHVGIKSQFIPRAPDQSISQQSSPSSINSSDQLQNSYVVGIRSQFIPRAPDQSNSQQSSPGSSNSSDLLQNSAPVPSNSQQSTPDSNSGTDQLEETDLNSSILSEFAAYNLQVQQAANVYPRLFDLSFPDDVVKENFYNEGIYFALDNGLYEVGLLPEQLANAALEAFPHLTPLEYFKVVSNTLELILQNGGIGTEGNYQVLARLNAKAFADAADSVKVNDARSALHAIIVGAGTFIRSLYLDSPEGIRYAVATFADQFSKVPSTGGFQ